MTCRLTTACSDPGRDKVHTPDCIASFGISAHAPQCRAQSLMRDVGRHDPCAKASCLVGIRKSQSGDTKLYAPFGVNDVLASVMRPNPSFPLAPRSSYYQKADRWRTLWPELVVEHFAEAESLATAGGSGIK